MRHQIAISILLALWSSSATASNVLEKKLPFPSPIQWASGDAEISLVGMAWGPANSPEMIAKGRQPTAMEKPESFPDRSYGLAMGFQAKAPRLIAPHMSTCSGLARVKNVDGDFENPSMLTPSGFVPILGPPCGSMDVYFRGSNMTDYWSFFPALPSQTEFLFQVMRSGNSILTFRVLLKRADIVLVNASSAMISEEQDFTKSFTGTIGPSSKLRLQLTRKGSTLSGTQQYERAGETSFLTGRVDSFGNFILEEQYPKGHATGIFKGRSSDDFRSMNGYFSKPDGTRLQSFQFHEAANEP